MFDLKLYLPISLETIFFKILILIRVVKELLQCSFSTILVNNFLGLHPWMHMGHACISVCFTTDLCVCLKQ